ncbi:MAG: hypothetical protein R3B13_34495 [Polyangiaceae bacterium]
MSEGQPVQGVQGGVIARIVVVMALLPAVYAFERSAYYGMRAVLFLHMNRELGMSPSDTSVVYKFVSIFGLATVILGGLLCIVLRPAIVAAVGAAIGIAGYGAMAIASDKTVLWGALFVLGLGQGLFKPALLAHAARELPFPRFHLRGAAFVALYAAINSGALTGTSGGALAAATSPSTSFAVSLVLAIVAFVICVVVMGADLFVKVNAPRAPTPPAGRVVLAGLLLCTALLPYHAAQGVGADIQFDALRSAPSSFGMLQTLNPVIVFIVCIVAFLVLTGLHFTRVGDLSPWIVGAGLVVFALGTAPLMMATTAGSGSSTALVGLSVVVMAIGEALVGPLGMSRVLGDIPPRFVGLAASVWLLFAGAASWAGSGMAAAWRAAAPVMFVGVVVVCLVIGVAVLALSRYALRNVYAPATEAAPESGAEPEPVAEL